AELHCTVTVVFTNCTLTRATRDRILPQSISFGLYEFFCDGRIRFLNWVSMSQLMVGLISIVNLEVFIGVFGLGSTATESPALTFTLYGGLNEKLALFSLFHRVFKYVFGISPTLTLWKRDIKANGILICWPIIVGLSRGMPHRRNI
ncbi:hypothetical protein L9F63_024905, partial [Diploptera punctata]